MIRNLKVLGLALVALFALSAMVASAASAQTQGKITSDGPVTLKGEDEGGAGSNFFKFPELPGQVECPGSTYTGHRFNITPHEVIPVNQTTVTITPKYNNATCTANSLKATVTMEGCDFVFHLGVTTATAEEYGITADLVCPAGKNVVVHLYASATSEAVTLCTLKIGAQNGITGLDVINETDGTGKTLDTITITGTSKNIKASSSGACGAKETAAAEYKATVTIKGFNAAGVETGVTITDQ